jgi:hypothetical protein
MREREEQGKRKSRWSGFYFTAYPWRGGTVAARISLEEGAAHCSGAAALLFVASRQEAFMAR